MKVCVVGGGISGVSSAFLIQHYTPHEVVLVEKGEIGGKARTIYEHGYRIETGPNGFLDNKEEIKKLIHDSGFEGEVIKSRACAERRFVFSNGKLFEVSGNPLSFLLSGPLSLKGKVRLFAEPFIPTVAGDESLERFVSRRLGKEMLVKLIGPMAVGVYAADPSSLSMNSAFPRIKEIERKYGSLIKGLFSLVVNKRAGLGSASGGFSSKLLSFREGVGSFVGHLASEINVIEGKVTGIEKLGDGYGVKYDSGIIEADALVLAVPSYALSGILGELDPQLSNRLLEEQYAPINVVAVGFERRYASDVVNSFGYLFSLDSIVDVIGVLFDSSMFDGRSDDTHFLVRLMVGGGINRNSVFKREAIEIALRELQRSAGVYAPFDYVRVIRHPRGIPMYTLGHEELQQMIREFENSHSNVYITGNAFWGISLNDCVKSSYEILRRVKGA